MNHSQNTPPDPSKAEAEAFWNLVQALCAGTISGAQQRELEAHLLTNPTLRRRFVEYRSLDAELQWWHRTDETSTTMDEGSPPPIVLDPQGSLLDPAADLALPMEEMELGNRSAHLPLVRLSNFGMWGGAFALGLLLLVWFGMDWFRADQPVEQVAEESPKYASIVAATDARWSGGTVPGAGGWLPTGCVHLRSGQVEIQFASGAKIVLKGPAEFAALSPTEARLESGSLTARVDGSKTTFRIHTPTAKVVDLGTEFGLSVAASGETDVAVFDGMVDVASDPIPNSYETPARSESASEKPARRLTAGEALRIDWDGQFRRISTITDETFPLLGGSSQPPGKSRPPLILEVSDTLREGNPKFYRVVSEGFGEDVKAYVDRNYQWNGIDVTGIPGFLAAADYVMPFNDDYMRDDLEVTVTLARPATVYVLFDDRGAPPDWLRESFVDTGSDVGLDEDHGPWPRRKLALGTGPGVSVDRMFSVWKQEVRQGGPVILGPRYGLKNARAMYGIVVTPLENNESREGSEDAR